MVPISEGNRLPGLRAFRFAAAQLSRASGFRGRVAPLGSHRDGPGRELSPRAGLPPPRPSAASEGICLASGVDLLPAEALRSRLLRGCRPAGAADFHPAGACRRWHLPASLLFSGWHFAKLYHPYLVVTLQKPVLLPLTNTNNCKCSL